MLPTYITFTFFVGHLQNSAIQYLCDHLHIAGAISSCAAMYTVSFNPVGIFLPRIGSASVCSMTQDESKSSSSSKPSGTETSLKSPPPRPHRP